MINKEEILNNKYIKEVISKRNVSDVEIEKNIIALKEYVDMIDSYGDSKKYCGLNLNEDFIEISSELEKPFVSLKSCRDVYDLKIKEELGKNYIWDDFSSPHYKNLINEDIYFTENRKEIRSILNNNFRDFIDNPSAPSKGVYIYGKVGVGKTFMTTLFAQAVSKKTDIAHISFPKFIKDIKGEYSKEDKLLTKMFDPISEATVLIIDDIGAEHISQWSTNEILLNILQIRTETGKFTVFTSNYNLAQLKSRYVAQTRDIIGADRIVKRIQRTVDLIMMEDK